MAINDIINESWQGHGHGEVEDALKAVLVQLLDAVERIPQGGISIDELSDSLKTLINNAVPNTRKVNNKALNSDITLGAADVGALPADTTIPSKTSDLNNDSGFVTSTTMTTALAGKQDTLTFDNAPTANSNNPVKSGGIKTYVDGKATITEIATSQDGTFTITQSDGNSYTVNLNHTHPLYLKYQLLADEAAYNALATKDSSTLYLIPET